MVLPPIWKRRSSRGSGQKKTTLITMIRNEKASLKRFVHMLYLYSIELSFDHLLRRIEEYIKSYRKYPNIECYFLMSPLLPV